MSYHDFEMGLSADEVKERNRAAVVGMSEAQAKQQQAEKKHSKFILNKIYRPTGVFEELEKEIWREATKPMRRRLH